VPATTVTQDIVTQHIITTTVAEATTTTTTSPRLSVDLGTSEGNDPEESSSSSPPRDAFDAHGGKILFTCSFGRKPGQIGIQEYEGGFSYGLEVSVSPDGQTIAISDPANMRVQLFNSSGTLRRTIPVQAQDLVLGPGGRLFLLAWERGVRVIEADGTDSRISCARSPWELVLDGNAVWVRADGDLGGNVYVKVYEDGSPLDLASQEASECLGVPVGGMVYLLSRTSLAVRDPIAGTQRIIELVPSIVPANLPVDELRSLGGDANRDFYGMVRIWGPGWSGAESWYFFKLSPSGACGGSVMLPLDFYASGGWTVSSSGKMIEVRTTKAGAAIIEYTFK
jgi:hypothetical protein